MKATPTAFGQYYANRRLKAQWGEVRKLCARTAYGSTPHMAFQTPCPARFPISSSKTTGLFPAGRNPPRKALGITLRLAAKLHKGSHQLRCISGENAKNSSTPQNHARRICCNPPPLPNTATATEPVALRSAWSKKPAPAFPPFPRLQRGLGDIQL